VRFVKKVNERGVVTLPTEVREALVALGLSSQEAREALGSISPNGDRVVFTGEVDEAAKRDLFSGALCLILPSFYEAQGIVIAEAWAQGRPVIASRVGGIPYLVDDGQDGLLYPYGDLAALAACLRRIAEDTSVASEMGRAGRDKARTSLTWEAIAPRYEELYESLVRQASRD